jgi:hypothetical protein
MDNQINLILDNDDYSPEQKMTMISDIRAMQKEQETSSPVDSGYKRQTKLRHAPEPTEEEREKTGHEKALSKSDDWKDVEYNIPFSPSFLETKLTGKDTKNQKPTGYKIGNVDGISGVTCRKLMAGDNMRVAALVPRWKQHLIGDENINPLSGDEFDPINLLFLLISTALQEWDFENNCPTPFSLSVINTFIDFTSKADEITVNHVLDTDPEILYSLAAEMYLGNASFFMKIYSRLGIIKEGISMIRGMSLKIMRGLKKAVQNLEEIDDLEEQQELENQIDLSTGGPSVGSGTLLLGQSEKTTKAS